MSLTINPKITFNGKEAREGILDPAFNRPNIKEIMSVRNGMKAQEQIAFLRRINKVSRVDPGCGLGKRDLQLGMEEKTWNPSPIKMWFDFCEDDLEDTFFVYLTENGVNRRDVSKVNEFWVKWVLEIFTDAANDDFLRFAFLGDTLADNVSGGGVITNGVAPEDYQQIDGIWKQIFADVTAVLTPRVVITENAAVSKAAQLALADDAAYQAMSGAYDNADSRLRSAPDKIYLLSGTLFRNRRREIESKTPGLDAWALNQDKKIDNDKMMFNGIPVYNMDTIWDRHILADFDNGTTYDLPNRCILTTKSNLVAGFDEEKAHNAFRTWYEEQDEAVNFKGLYKTDVKVMRPFLTSVAY